MKDEFHAAVSTYCPLFLPVQRRLTNFSEFGGSVLIANQYMSKLSSLLEV